MSWRGRRRELVRRALGPFERLTTRGRSVLAAGGTAIVCAIALGQRDLLRVGVLLVLVPVLTVFVLGRSRYRLACTRNVTPSRIEVGVTAQVVLEVANVSSTRCGLVLAEEQVPFTLGGRPRFVLPGLEPGERRAVSYPVRSDVRGKFAVGPLSLTLTDPFGMGEHRRSFTSRDQLVVTPKVVALPRVSLTGDWTGSGDTRPRAVAASGEDDVTTREYRQGDDLRRVHWRTTAKRGELMVRREEQPWQSRATLVLDRRRVAHRGEGDASTFEWAVSAIASIAIHLVERGYAVRLADGSDQQDGVADQWSQGAGYLAELSATFVLDTLAGVQPAGEVELDRAVRSAGRSATGGLVVAALGEISQADAGLLAALNQPGTTCVALVAATHAAGAGAADAAGPVGAKGTAVGAAPAAFDGPLDALRSAGWDVVPAHHGEPFGHTWARVGSGRLLGAGGRR